MNTLERHKTQVNHALQFLAKAKFTNAENLQLAAGRNRRGFPTQLKKLGLILGREMAGGTIYGLSKLGADTVGAKQYDIHKVTSSRVEHATIAQYETLMAVRKLGVTSYQFEPQEFSHDNRPDIIWVLPNSSKIHIEVELSAKTPGDGDLDKFFLKLLSLRTVVIFKDKMLFERYSSAAHKYISEGIPDWQFLDGKWIKFGELITYDREAWKRIEFKMHKDDLSFRLGAIYDWVKGGY